MDDPISQLPIFNLRLFPGDLAVFSIDAPWLEFPVSPYLNGGFARTRNYICVYVDPAHDQRVVLV